MVNRRRAISQLGGVFTGLIFVPKLIRAQPTLPFFSGNATVPYPPASGSGAACTTLRDTPGTASNNLFANTTYLYFATSFDASASYTNCTQVWSFKRTGSPSGTVKGAIYANATDRPGSIVGTAGDTVAVSSVGTSQGDITLPNISANLTNGTRYWVVSIFSTAGTDSSNKIEGFNGGPGTGANHIWVSTDGSTWADLDSFVAFNCKVYST